MTTAEHVIFRTTPRQRFMRRISLYAGDRVRHLWTPQMGDGLKVTDAVGNLITWANAPVITALGSGFSQAFNGTSDRGVLADHAQHSFGDSSVDSAFSVVALANVTNTAAARVMLGKMDAASAALEWSFNIGSTDVLQLQVADQSAGVFPNRSSDSAITQAAWKLFVATYSAATGGATAMNDVTLYQDAVAIASTATNNAGYVAMENLATGVNIGARGGTGSLWFSGSLALTLLVPGVLSAASITQIKNEVNAYYGLVL